MAEQAQSISDAMNAASGEDSASVETTFRRSDRETPEKKERAEKPDKPEKTAKPEKTSIQDLKTLDQTIKEPTAEAPLAKAWEAPGYTKMWKEDSRKALEAFAADPKNEAYIKAITGELDQTYGYIGQRNQELAGYKKRYEPLNDLLGQAERNFNINGLTLDSGLRQQMAVAESLVQNPDETIPWLGERYKPREPAKVLQRLAQQWGQDPAQVFQDQPYIDPAVSQTLNSLRQEIQQVNGWRQQQEQQAQQQQQRQRQEIYNAALRESEAFGSEKDESGQLKHPYYEELFPQMIQAVQLGHAKTPHEAYSIAVKFHPAAQAELTKQAEKLALETAARRTSETLQASEASRNVNGKPAGREQQASTIEEAMRRAKKQLDR